MEELSAGGPETPGRPRLVPTWVWVLVGAGVLVLGVAAAGLGGSSAPPSSGGAAPSPSSSPVAYRTTRPGPLTYLDVGTVCPPRTHGRRSLTVTFELENVGGLGVAVLDVTPTLPLAGLTVSGPVLSGGTCSTPGRDRGSQTVPVSGSRFYTMSFRLPRRCPKPYPVQATYRIDVNNQEMTTTLPLLPDLGATSFASCPDPS